MVLGSDRRRRRIVGSRINAGGSSVSGDRHFSGGIKASFGRPVWVSPEPPSDVVKELIYHFLEVIELPEKEIKYETIDWIAKRLVARFLG